MAESGARRGRSSVRRTLIVGDVHGCRAELERLLEAVSFDDRDRLVFVGDLVVRGPDSLGVLALARDTSAVVVRGNHEERVLAEGRRLTALPPTRPLSRAHHELAESLGSADWALLERTPLFCELPEHGLTVVHAGIDPTLPLGEQDPATLLFVRHAKTRSGKKKLWGEVHEGPVQYVFGHNAIERVQLHPFATGLDSGCVYGGQLTALILDEGETIPSDPLRRRANLVSVDAERVHFDPHAKDG